jgi:aryl-alcohol dehydrogenase-like predicted oxidoreductase
MSGDYGYADDRAAIATIQRAIDLGISLLDTADLYGFGHNEDLVGRAIRGRREQVVLATKFGNVFDPDTQVAGGICGRPDYVRQACEASLRRLGVDVIDLYQQHRVDPAMPIEETVGALAELVAEGKIRYIGLSEALSPDLRRAAAVHPIATVQSEYSLLERTVEAGVLGTCEQLGIGFLAFAPLVRGLLAGSLTPQRQLEAGDYRLTRFPRVGPEHLAANARLAQVVADVAAGHPGSTSGQVALAWLLARRPWIVPIPGTKRIRYVQENAAAADLQLTADETARLDELAGEVHGDRYRPAKTPDWASPPQTA